MIVALQTESVRIRHVFLAVCIALVWGFNFVVIVVGLDRLPPLLFSALRFTLAAIPAALFLRSPRAPWRWVVVVAMLLGVGQFSLLFWGMDIGMPAGLSSLVLQSQAVFTAAFAALLLSERPGRQRLLGLGIALAGIGLVAADLTGQATAVSFVLVLGAAACWGASNVATRVAAPPDVLSFMVWVSAVAAMPLFALSLVFEGWETGVRAVRSIDLTGLGALAYIAFASTLFGFGAWGWLLRRYDASVVAPFSLLVPVFGMSSAALLLNERFGVLDVLGGLLVLAGVLLGNAAPRRRRSPVDPEQETPQPVAVS